MTVQADAAVAVSPISVPRSAAVLEERKARPVLWWAGFGAVVLAYQVYLYTAWLVSGDAKHVRTGPSTVPGWMKVELNIWQVVGVVAAVSIVYFFVVRRWRREGHLTLNGMFCLTFLTLYWQDVLIQYLVPSFAWNTYMFNRAGWYAHIPVVLPPQRNHFAEPLVWGIACYIYLMFAAVIIGAWIMRKIKSRWPRMGKMGIILTSFALFFLFDTAAETLMLLGGVYSYPGAPRWATLYGGHYFQFPLYEGVLFGACWAAWCCIRYFTDDKGRTVAERGIDEVKVSEKGKIGVRFLAIVGVCNAIFLVFTLLWGLASLSSSPWPKDIVNRSYLNGNLCGPATPYACPGPSIPISRPHSAYLDSRGQLVVPPGNTLPGHG
jgi:hypothetical protein